MILVRDVFRLKFGHAKQAKELLKEGYEINKKEGYGKNKSRALTDLVGQSYTLVLESTFDSLSDYEAEMKDTFKSDDWKKWYPKFAEHAESGYREIFNIIEF